MVCHDFATKLKITFFKSFSLRIWLNLFKMSVIIYILKVEIKCFIQIKMDKNKCCYENAEFCVSDID
ncbi:hypothetical protein RT99_00195 [Flavobacterium sp. MEB061]|nr:hypothetical protein RT99_00195 [Flavobacterium sp. MEB061]